ncbi:hypothetical protein [Fictibacillus marinisediminis]|uniref:hypothetical protein n=1 Tax=Fictibacillus marinisediminis TaxID=2878389 RepID=UPI003AFA8ADF
MGADHYSGPALKGLKPRKAIGSVNYSEFAISLSATIGFLISLDSKTMNYPLYCLL